MNLELTELLTLLPKGCSVELIERKIVDAATGKIKKATSIELVHAEAPYPFSSIADVATAIRLAGALGTLHLVRQPLIDAPDVPKLPLESHEATTEDYGPLESGEDEPVQKEEAQLPPPPRVITPGGPVASQFASRVTSRNPKDKTPLVPAVPASV